MVLGASLLAACQTDKFCADAGCKMDGGAGEGPTGGKTSSGGDEATGGKSATGGSATGGSGGERNGSGGDMLGGAAGAETSSGGRPDGSGGVLVDPGELDGSIAASLIDILPGGSAKVMVALERSKGFEGTVLVSLEGAPDFSGTQVFAAPNDDDVTLTVAATAETEQGYYEAAVIAESTDGLLSVEIPLHIRVRGAPGTLDLTFGDREMPWVGEGTQAEAAVDDAGFVYLRNQQTIFRFDQHGVLDESFAPEGLAEELGPMIGLEDGVLIGTQGSSTAPAVLHVRGTGEKDPGWTGAGHFGGSFMSLSDLPWSLGRRDDRVVTAADYAYPASQIQVFSSTGAVDTSFSEIVYLSSSTTKQARIDSQGRVVVAELDAVGAPMGRLLPDGSRDESFGNAGALAFSVPDPAVLDFEILSDDGLAILVRETNYPSPVRLAIWTPSSSGGVLVYHDLTHPPHSLLRLDGDKILTTGLEGDRWPPTVIRLYTRDGAPVTSFGNNGAISLNPMSAAHYAPLPAFDRLLWKEPAFDPKANRLIAYGNDLGKLYLYSIWL